MITEEVISSLQRYVWPVLRHCEVLKCPVLADLMVRVNAWLSGLTTQGGKRRWMGLRRERGP